MMQPTDVYQPVGQEEEIQVEEQDERTATVKNLLDSSKGQERLLELILAQFHTLNSQIERMNYRLVALETAVREVENRPSQSSSSDTRGTTIASTSASVSAAIPKDRRGQLILPPGIGGPRPSITKILSSPPVVTLQDEENAAKVFLDEEDRKKREAEDFARQKREEQERLARLEEEMKRKEIEEEKKRQELMKKAEDERKRKEELSLKTKSLMSDLFNDMEISSSGGLLFPDEVDSSSNKNKEGLIKGLGLFDD